MRRERGREGERARARREGGKEIVESVHLLVCVCVCLRM